MRTAIIIIGGFLLWGICLGIAQAYRRFRNSGPNFPGTTMGTATTSFIGLWFVAAGVNMWMGVTRAGYSVEEELPIFLAIFLLPSAVAALVKWKFL